MQLASTVVTVPRPGQKFASVYSEKSPISARFVWSPPILGTIIRLVSLPKEVVALPDDG
jgi:hypothetical protein